MPEVNIKVDAIDESEEALDSASKNVKGLGETAEQAGKRAKGGFDDAGLSLQGLTRGIERGYGIMTRLDLTQISLTQSSERVAQAQERYTRAIAENGAASQEAVQANRELESAQAALEKTQLRARLSYVMVAGDIATIAARAPQAAAALRGMGVATMTLAGNLTALQIAGGAATALLVGLAAAGTLFSEEVGKGATATEELRIAREEAEKHGKPNDMGPVLEPLRGFVDELTEVIPGFTTATDEWKQAQERLNDAEISVALQDGIKLEGDRTAALMESARATAELDARNRSLVSGTQAVLGVDLSQWSDGFRESMLATAGVSKEFIASLRPVVDIEALLAGQSDETKVAMLEQRNVTAYKDETTEEFHARLKALVGEEAYAKLQFDETGRSIVAQAAATDRLAESTRSATSGGSFGTSMFSSGFSRASQDPGRASDDLDLYREELQYMLSQNPGGLNNPGTQEWFNILNNSNVQAGHLASAGYQNMRQGALKPLIMAANGYDGVVSEPTMFMAGERGAEHVKVTPGGGQGGGGVNVNLTMTGAAGQAQRAGMMVERTVYMSLRRAGLGRY